MNIDEIFGSAELFDRDSSEHTEAITMNSLERYSLDKEDDPLTTALSEATHITEDIKQTYIDMAAIYTADMRNNIFKNQLDLHKDYPAYSIDEWNNFLIDRIVSVYISKHKRTILKAAAEDNLHNPISKNKRDSIQLIKNLEEQEQQENNNNICIIRIPDIYDEE